MRQAPDKMWIWRDKTKKGCTWQPFQVYKVKINYSSLPLLIMPSATKTPNKAAPLKAMLMMSRVIMRPSFMADFPSPWDLTGCRLQIRKSLDCDFATCDLLLVTCYLRLYSPYYTHPAIGVNASGSLCQQVSMRRLRLSIDLIPIFYYHASLAVLKLILWSSR